MDERENLNNEENLAEAQPEPQSGTAEAVNEIDQLKKELEEQKEKFIRIYAEFDNYKRRNAKERIDLIQTAGREVLQSLLEVLDDSERAEKQLQKTDDIDQLREGVQLVFSKFRTIMHSKGLKDPDLHEAITEIPVEDESMKGKVVDQVEKGYTLNDKIIRFAKVVVGK